MTSISIDRMTIDAPHLGRGGGERLARLVLDGLRSAGIASGTSIPSLSVAVCDVGDGRDALARQIVDEVIGQITRLG
jgi:hypothetical protein